MKNNVRISNKLISIILFVFIIFSVQIANADNTLEIVGGQTNVNTAATISVIMENDSAIVAFQIDIPIPVELDYITGTVILNPARAVGHQISASLLSGGVLRIFGYSLNNTPFNGNSGELCSFQLQAHSLPGIYNLNLTTAVLGNTQSNNIITGFQNGTLMVMGSDIAISTSSINFGRVPLLSSNDKYVTIYNNGNVSLNIQNIISSNQYFTVIGSIPLTIGVGSSSSLQLRFSSEVKGTYNETMTIYSDDADQGSIEIEMLAVAFAVNELHTGNMFAFSDGYASLDFSINNMEPFVGFQFDLILPSPLSFVPDSIFLSERKANQSILANMLNSNTLRIVAYSIDNQTFSGNNGKILELGFNVEGVGGYYGISISNVIIGDTLGLNAVSAYTGGSLQVAAADINAVNSLNFGDVSILESLTKTLDIYNTGTDTLKIETIQFTDASFSSTQLLPLNINPGLSSVLEVSFSNVNEGAVAGIMNLYSNDPDENPYAINLSANAFIPNYISVKDSLYSYGDTMFVDINVVNLEPFTGFQFDLHFTDSLSCLNNLVQLGQRAVDQIYQVTTINSTTIRLIAFSMSQSNFSGNNGPIIHIPLVGDSAVYGKIPLTIDNAILGNAQSQNILWGINNDSIVIARSQEIALQTGWNILSLNVIPEDNGLMSVFQDIISDNHLIKVISQSGGIIQYIPDIGWINTIGNISKTEGYYIKVSDNDTLCQEGIPIGIPVIIPLQTGWNIMSYPLVTEQLAITVLQPLINNGSLIKVINQAGGFIQYIPDLGLINTIGNFKSGEGYYIKVNTDVLLTINESAKSTSDQYTEFHEANYFISNTGYPYNPMNFIISKIECEGFELEEGDEIAVYDDEILVGNMVVSLTSDEIQIITTRADDPLTIEIDGFREGNNFSFKYWDKSQNRVYDNISVYNSTGELTYTSLGTFIGELKIITTGLSMPEIHTATYLMQNFPNPFSVKTTIEYGLADEGKVILEMYDISGRLLKTLINKYQDKGTYSIMVDKSALNQGIYYYKLKVWKNEVVYEETKKMIVK